MIIPDDLDMRIQQALSDFWSTREKQITRQKNSDEADRGNRGAVTGGKQLDGFVTLVRDVLVLNGIKEKKIFFDSDLELPGYFRPNKKWDLLVVDRRELVIAIEFKSQIGPSFGNNFNNRTEEAMGSALDLWTAYREGVFGTQKTPWLGYFMVLEDCKKSNKPVKARSPHFHVLDEFVDSSYIERYEIFCRKLLLERQYSSACFLTTGMDERGKISANCPDPSLSYRSFLTSMLGAAIAHVNARR